MYTKIQLKHVTITPKGTQGTLHSTKKTKQHRILRHCFADKVVMLLPTKINSANYKQVALSASFLFLFIMYPYEFVENSKCKSFWKMLPDTTKSEKELKNAYSNCKHIESPTKTKQTCQKYGRCVCKMTNSGERITCLYKGFTLKNGDAKSVVISKQQIASSYFADYQTTNLESRQFGNAKIQTLYLMLRKLVTIHRLAFEGQYNTLIQLNIYEALLLEIPVYCMNNFKQLTTLLLRNWKNLKTVGDNLFDKMKSAASIRYVGLRECSIEYIGKNAFAPFINIGHLDLSYNRLSTISPNCIPQNNKLYIVYLSDNHFTNLPLEFLNAVNKSKTTMPINVDMKRNNVNNYEMNLNILMRLHLQISYEFVENSKCKSFWKMLPDTTKSEKELKNAYSHCKHIESPTKTIETCQKYGRCECKMTNSGERIACTYTGFTLKNEDAKSVVISRQQIASYYFVDYQTTNLESRQFGNAKIKNFDLMLMKLVTIHRLAFEGQYNTLIELHIYEALLSEIPVYCMNNFKQLTTLQLRNWKNLKTVGDNLFDEMKSADSIRYVSLTKCSIEYIGKNAFAPFINIGQLDLSYNRLSTISANCIPQNNKLYIVSLSDNYFTILPIEFLDAVNIRKTTMSIKVDMERNNITNYNMNFNMLMRLHLKISYQFVENDKCKRFWMLLPDTTISEKELKNAYTKCKPTTALNTCQSKYGDCRCSMIENIVSISCNYIGFTLKTLAAKNVANSQHQVTVYQFVDKETTKLESRQFGSANIKNLILVMNNLVGIHRSAFEGQYDTLNRLKISKALLSEIPVECLNKIEHLTTLYIIEWKRLKRIEENVFNEMKSAASITYVSLTKCSIEYIGKNAFAPFINIGHLDLSYNRLSTISADCIPQNNKLYIVSLSDNYFTVLPIEFLNAVNIRKTTRPIKVDMERNNITNYNMDLKMLMRLHLKISYEFVETDKCKIFWKMLPDTTKSKKDLKNAYANCYSNIDRPTTTIETCQKYGRCDCIMINRSERITCGYRGFTLKTGDAKSVVISQQQIISYSLSDDQTNSLEARQFGNANIKRFDLLMNKLVKINSLAFEGQFNTLIHLTIYDALLSEIPVYCMNNFKQLTTLQLRNWKNLKIVGDYLFDKMKSAASIRYVALAKCGIEYIGKNAFAPFTNIEHLDLSFNRLSTISANCIPQNNKLYIVSLR
ncbi:hypothetical protein GQR58_017337 [Nymphon striatum]|nr:hypothetical protein GQR58_017337 [Nymphon striatum]